MSKAAYPSKEDNSLKFGRTLSHPTHPSEEVVISGIAGSFPSAENVDVFKEKLFNKIDMITRSRWMDFEHPEVSKRAGVIKNTEKFDAGFFGIHRRQGHTLDPMTRIFLEKAVECIMDAGIRPSELKNTRTGVFMAACSMETEAKWPAEFTEPNWYTFCGITKFMLSQRISYFLQLKGPTVIVDTACSSSLYALEHAFKAIKLGECDNAIVGGVNICLHPYASVQFARLGVLSPDGCCRPFDKDGKGYVRSDTVCSIFLQKAKDAKRIYAQIIHAKTSCDGYKEQGITYPSGEDQEHLFREFYEECNIDPLNLSFIEAHGTGTIVGDPEECQSIDQVFATNKRESVLIGSVKSNIGHSEGASALTSIVKCILAMEADVIPPNINFDAPKEGIISIKEGRLEVVTNCRPFRDNRGLLGINSFGFGGANGHILLKPNPKNKTNAVPQDDLPRLVCVSSRTKEGVLAFLNDISHKQMNVEYIKLVHDLFSENIPNHIYRGFAITSNSGEISKSVNALGIKRTDLYLVFGEVSNWCLVAKDLIGVPIVQDTVRRIDDILLKKNIHIMKIINENLKVPHDILGSVILQICIANIIKALNIECQGAIGYSLGELVCAYYNGNITLEETIYFACLVEKEYYSNVNKIENGITGSQKIVGHKINGENGIPEESSDTYCTNLFKKIKGILYVNGTLKNNHTVLEHFLEILRQPIPANFVLPKKTVVWEIDFTPLKVSADDDIHLLTFNTFPHTNHLVRLLQILGRLYLLGYNPDISELYPKVEFPVSKGTPMISPKIMWNHHRDWFVLKFRPPVIREQRKYKIKLDSDWGFVAGHVIDGRNLFPAAGYLYLVWDVFTIMLNVDLEYVSVTFENCRFLRATTVPQSGTLELNVTVFTNSGYFEVTEADTPVVTGRIFLADNVQDEFPTLSRSLVARKGIPMQTKDVYKELRLRGYNYTGLFKAIKEYQTDEAKGLVRWDDNWIAFIDNLFQTKILQTDTRFLYVPTDIAKLTIAATMHRKYITSLIENEQEPYLPVYYYPEADLTRAGGIEVRGLIASSINRKKYLGTPVLEKYEFVPNNSNLMLPQSVRINMQIILENIMLYSLHIVEVIESDLDPDYNLLSPIINAALQDQPLITPNIKIFSKIPVETEFPVEAKSLDANDEYTMVVVSNVFNRPQMLNQVLQATAKNGYILARESKDFDISEVSSSNVTIKTVHYTSTETLVLFSRTPKLANRIHIKIADTNNLEWIPEVQDAMKTGHEIVLYTENEPFGGILGFVNCLRREPDGGNVKCIFLMDQTKVYSPADNFYIEQLNKNLAINIYKNGKWGTYRHLLLDDVVEQKTEHCYVNITVKGDLSSLKWIEGPLSLDYQNVDPEKQLVEIYYSALNFKDVMTATGKISADVVTTDRLEQECLQGFEFSGRTTSGSRVMGMVTNGALATMILADTYLLWPVPDSWSLAEAATVPVVYGTVIYALFIRGDLKRGQSILIHSGTGGIGQAAIRIALHNDCKVFTTVGTDEKKEFLKKVYPQLNEQNIGNSHDLSFEQMVMRETDGKGVDVVLNSLADDKLLASVRCLSRGGKFLEIGRFDIASNSPLSFTLLEREVSFHGVMLDKLFTASPIEKQKVGDYLSRYIYNGAIKPINGVVFKADEIEKTFRFMAGGKHKGKVIVEIREEEEEKIIQPKRQTFPCIPRYSCYPDKSYIIIGGLGGFGLELADWLVLRGARNIVLTSRSGIQTGYQHMRVRIWESYGVFVKISTADLTSRAGCVQLINEALQLGPLNGLFNLAVVLEDAIFENQTIEKFQKSLAPKALVTKYMDEITRKLCPDIREFVVFSSVSCGRGNAGQTNYGMGNSIMERICEQRRKDGHAALAIEWGAIGEVGLVAEMQENHAELEISGTLQQRISSCLKVLDTLLKQKDAPIVSCMVVAEKIGRGSNNIVDCVANILGIADIKTVSPQSTLAELGMDSMTALEIKNTLEREYETFLTAKAIRSLTFARLQELADEKCSDVDSSKVSTNEDDQKNTIILFDFIPRDVSNLKPAVRMKTKLDKNEIGPTIILLPGIEGFAKLFEPLAEKLDAHAISFQYDYENPTDNITDLAAQYVQHVESILKDGQKLVMAAHSYGVVIALELLSLLEKRGLTGTLFCIDGSPSLSHKFFQVAKAETEESFLTNMICIMLAFYISEDIIFEKREVIEQCKTLDEKIDVALELGKDVLFYTREEQKKLFLGLHRRIISLSQYKPSYSSIKSRVKLCKPTMLPLQQMSDDYDLTEICKKPIEVETYKGDHVTIVNNEALIKEINLYVNQSC